MNNKKIARILLMGKTGTGKSSFINYFVGKDVAKTGIGRPVTQSMDKYKVDCKGFTIDVFDTKGLEVENFDVIKEDIIREIKKRNNSSDIFDWFHTIFYCLSLSNSRFEEHEIKFLKTIKEEISQNIHIILTNCDDKVRDKEKIEGMRDKIYKSIGKESKIYEVCSVEMIKRNGTKISPSGKEVIVDGVFTLLWDDISKKLAGDYSKRTKEEIRKNINIFENDIVPEVKKKFGAIKLLYEELMNAGVETYLEKEFSPKIELYEMRIEKMVTQIEDNLNKTLDELKTFYGLYYKNTAGFISWSEFTLHSFIDEIVDIDIDSILNNSKLGKLMKKLENESFNLLDLLKILKEFLFLGTTFSGLVEELFKDMKSRLNTYPLEEKLYSDFVNLLKN